MKRTYVWIDVLRLFLALLVCVVHFKCALSPYVVWLTPIAVPGFFAISGFLLWEKPRKSYERAIVKIMKIIGVSYLIYLPVYIWLYTTPDWHELRNWVNMLLFNMPLGMEHLWYLLAYFYVLVVVTPMKDWLERHPSVLLAGGLLLVAGNLLMRQLDVEGYMWRNWLLTGIPYFLLGQYLHYWYEKRQCSFLSSDNSWVNRIGHWGALYSLDIYILHPVVYIGCGYTLCGLFIFRAAMWWFAPLVMFLLCWLISYLRHLVVK